MRPLLSTPHHGNGHDLIDPRAHETRNQIVFSGCIAAASLITRDTDGLFHVHLVYNNPPLCLLNTTAIRGEQLAVHRAAELIDTGHDATSGPRDSTLFIGHGAGSWYFSQAEPPGRKLCVVVQLILLASFHATLPLSTKFAAGHCPLNASFTLLHTSTRLSAHTTGTAHHHGPQSWIRVQTGVQPRVSHPPPGTSSPLEPQSRPKPKDDRRGG